MLEGDLPIFARGANEALLKELLQGLASYSKILSIDSQRKRRFSCQ